MVTVKQLENDNFLLKSTYEQLKCENTSFQGVKIPTYCIGSQSLKHKTSCEELSCIPEDYSMLDALLLAQWEDRIWKGSFRYDVTTSEIKVISGKRKFLAQLNEEWIDYLSEPEDNQICYRWDPLLFDCMKHQDKLLFCVASGMKANSELISSAAVPNGSILVISNATPVEYGHVFFVPFSCNRLYQFLDLGLLEMVMRVAVEIDNYSFRLFYSCAGFGASYMYFQACYLADVLPVELMPVDTLFSDGQRGIHIWTLVDYPIKTLLFEASSNIKMMVGVIAEICSHLQKRNIPFNLLISDCGRKLFLFLQQETLATSSTLSAWECAGYFLFKSRCEYSQVTEEDIFKRLSTVSLDHETFQIVKMLCCSIASKFDI